MRAALLVLVLVLTASAAPAHAAAPVDGQLTWDSAALRGAFGLATRDGALDLAPAGLAGEPIALRWSAAQGRLLTTNWTILRSPVPDSDVKLGDAPVERPLDLGRGELRNVRCRADCVLVLVPAGPDGSVGATGMADGLLARLDGPRLYWSDFSDPAQPGTVSHAFPAGTLVVGGPDGLRVADLAPSARGRVGLLLVNARADLHVDGRVERVDTTATGETTELAGGARLDTIRRATLFLTLEGASVEAPRGSAAVLLAPTADATLDGRLHAWGAHGELQEGARRIVLRDDEATLDGQLVLALASPQGGEPVAARVSGQATSIAIDGHLVGEASTGAAATASLVATLLLVLLFAKRHALLALYSRIAPSAVLDHPQRARIHAAVAARPGATPADISRVTGLGRVLVQYHLRRLEGGALVRVKEDGRKRRYFTAAGDVDAPDARAATLLGDRTRRVVAAAVAGAAAGATQQDLVARTGLSQRLVSYHLAQLEALGLVKVEPTWPRRYRPDASLEVLAAARDD